jgi:signal transduction histidine kinase
VLQALVDVSVDLLGADKSSVVLHQGDVDVVRAARNYSQSTLDELNHLLAGIPHVEPDGRNAQAQVYESADAAPAHIAGVMRAENEASHATLPVAVGARMFGAFGVGYVERHQFTDDDMRVYRALAARAAVAIQNAELYERAQQAASLEERQRLARELHDSVSQALYGIALGTRTARLRLGDDPGNAGEPIDYVMSLAQAGLAEMRALIFELRPESLQEEGLVSAIEKQAASISARYGLKATMELGEEPECALDVKEAFYRIAQEALHNVVKHAQAESVNITLGREDGAQVLRVEDDGRGFDPSGSFPGHVGLHSMQERAAKLGGTVVIESATGHGARVVARVPE